VNKNLRKIKEACIAANSLIGSLSFSPQITLSDVLLAIQVKQAYNQTIMVTMHGIFIDTNFNFDADVKWDLKARFLEFQNLKTINHIAELV
jgi:hypothetical protein